MRCPSVCLSHCAATCICFAAVWGRSAAISAGSVCAMIRGRRIDADCRSVLGYSRVLLMRWSTSCSDACREMNHATSLLGYYACLLAACRTIRHFAGWLRKERGRELCGKFEQAALAFWRRRRQGAPLTLSLTARRGPARLSLLLSRLERWAIVLE